MKLDGAYDVPAPRQKVWDAFQDPKQLKQMLLAVYGCFYEMAAQGVRTGELQGEPRLR